MKLAILIAGQPRFRVPFEEFTKQLQGYDHIDWFFYFWDKSLPRHPEHVHEVPTKWQNIPDKQTAVDMISEKLPANQSIAAFEIGNNEIVEPRGQLFSQFASLNKADQLRQLANNKYDLIFRTRIDTCLTEPVDLLDMKSQIDQDPQLIFTAANFRHYFNEFGMCDHMAITSPANMTIYTDLINHIPNYLNNGVGFHAEALLNFHLLSNNLKLKEVIPNAGIPIDPTYGVWGQ